MAEANSPEYPTAPLGRETSGSAQTVREILVQVAAVAVAWAEAIDTALGGAS